MQKLVAHAAGGEYKAGLAQLQAMHKEKLRARARQFFGANRIRAPSDRWLPSTLAVVGGGPVGARPGARARRAVDRVHRARTGARERRGLRSAGSTR